MNTVAIVGAGPAGLMAAERLAHLGHAVVIYDAMPSPGRKFLLAGRGGLNITHSEPLERFLPRYRETATHFAALLDQFSPDDMRRWCSELGEETFIGSSGRVFPKSFKASPLLRAWLRRLAGQGVTLRTGHRWTGFDSSRNLRFQTAAGETIVKPDATVLALGGASWPRLGSTGAWTGILADEGVSVAQLRPSNCGFRIMWSEFTCSQFAGAPLKRIALMFDGETVRGEAMLTVEGLEGGAVYALSGPVRDACRSHGDATITIDLRPDVECAELAGRLETARKGDSLSNRLRKQGGLAPQAIAILRDGTFGINALDGPRLADAIKRLPLRVTGVSSIDKAISSAGGIRWSELDGGLMLRARPGVFCAGEMLDWEAPTGGYLLQACFATGVAAAAGANAWLRAQSHVAA